MKQVVDKRHNNTIPTRNLITFISYLNHSKLQRPCLVFLEEGTSIESFIEWILSFLDEGRCLNLSSAKRKGSF